MKGLWFTYKATHLETTQNRCLNLREFIFQQALFCFKVIQNIIIIIVLVQIIVLRADLIVKKICWIIKLNNYVVQLLGSSSIPHDLGPLRFFYS